MRAITLLLLCTPSTRTDGRTHARTNTHALIYVRARTHTEYVILTDFPQQQWLRERASILHNAYIAYIVRIFFVSSWQASASGSVGRLRRADHELTTH